MFQPLDNSCSVVGLFGPSQPCPRLSLSLTHLNTKMTSRSCDFQSEITFFWYASYVQFMTVLCIVSNFPPQFALQFYLPFLPTLMWKPLGWQEKAESCPAGFILSIVSCQWLHVCVLLGDAILCYYFCFGYKVIVTTVRMYWNGLRSVGKTVSMFFFPGIVHNFINDFRLYLQNQ